MIYYWNTEKRKSFLHLASFLTVREVAVPGEPTGGEGFAWIWMFWALKKKKKKRKLRIDLYLFIYLRDAAIDQSKIGIRRFSASLA